ncbi:MAG TPA: EmrB/QacA family drug resistance transporter, partial [Solirubrobacteraceae bacterium]|nr:EmrB/QacA family drug resistance transporter [Solirubrobacteraceae bacterium]
QVVLGASPTGSGLQILPLMGGLLITSIGSGQIISRTGRYRPYPIAGTAIMVVGLFLLSTMDPQTSRATASAFMFVLGLGLGLTMQVLVLAVQNAVDYKDLGVATSGATLFRSIGGSVGTAVLGSIFSNRLASELTSVLPRSAGASLGTGASLNTAALKRLPPPIHSAYLTAFTNALSTVFIVAACVAAVAFLLSWALQQRPLRETIQASSTGLGESFAMPKHTDSLAEASRAMSLLIGREGRRALVAGLVQRAGVDLTPAAAWLLVRLGETDSAHPASIPQMCEDFDIPIDVGLEALRELDEKGLLRRDPAAGEDRGRVVGVTPAGAEIAARLVAERRATLERVCAGWQPEDNEELAGLLTRLARELSPDEAPAAASAAAV